MSKCILVTGGLGFIGSHLVRQLLGDPEAQVIVVDDLSGTVLDTDSIIDQIQAGMPGRLTVYRVPIHEFQRELDSYCSAYPTPATHAYEFSRIYHLASIVGPAAVLARSGFIAETIVRDTYAVIRLARRLGARLINVSTSEVYGGGANGYCKEDAPRVIRGRSSPRQEYAAGKLAAEVAIENLCREGGLDAVTVRPFNVAGIRQSGRGGFVLPRFIGQAILGLPLTVFGDGSQIRAFTDVRDVAVGMVLCAERGIAGCAYNVGNPANRISVGALADRVLAITGSVAGKRFVDPRGLYGTTYAEAPDKYPDATQLQELGWQPNYELDDIIRDTYAAMRDLREDDLYAISGLAEAEHQQPIPA